jgi:hypothetical protein
MAPAFAVFFASVHPLYPMLDEDLFRKQTYDFYERGKPPDGLWLVLFKLVLSIGIACNESLQASDLSLRTTLFRQSLASLHLVYIHGKLAGVQILLLHVST